MRSQRLSKFFLILSIPLAWVFLYPSLLISKEKDKTQWKRPRFTEQKRDRMKMVSTQIMTGHIPISNDTVLDAMRQVPRHLFIDTYLRAAAYADRPLPIGYGQTISQPFIVAYMTELLELSPGERVLEIGTGSGYQAAVLSEITPHVYTIEIIKKLGETAGKRLERLGYESVKVRIGDGYYGWKDEGPFDGIIVTCAAGHVPPPLIEQLKPGGRIVIPIGGAYQIQTLMVITKDSEGAVRSQQLIPVRFVPMTGTAEKQ